jgi:hypothetical protein
LEAMQQALPAAFVVLVCHTDGVVALPADRAIASFQGAEGSEAWLRADRRKRHQYCLHGPAGELAGKYSTTVQPIIDSLNKTGQPPLPIGECLA